MCVFNLLKLQPKTNIQFKLLQIRNFEPNFYSLSAHAQQFHTHSSIFKAYRIGVVRCVFRLSFDLQLTQHGHTAWLRHARSTRQKRKNIKLND